MSPTPFRARLVLLGASNLARDFRLVLQCVDATLARAHGGDATTKPPAGPATGPLQIFSACGHGRSYGTWSRVLFVRGLPGITRCGLWPALETAVAAHPEVPTYALLTDIGNDIAYGATPEDVARWVETCLQHLARLDLAVRTFPAMTLLPLASLRRLSRWKFELLRLALFPTHRTTYEQVRQRTVELQERLQALAERFAVPALEPDPNWLGSDHIHLRSRERRRAWGTILGLWLGEPENEPRSDQVASRGARTLSRLRWWRLTPERWSLAGVPLGSEQPAGRLRDSSEIWLY